MIHLPIRTLKILVVLYLLLPNILFQLFWFRTEISLLTITGLCVSFFFYAKNQVENETKKLDLTYRQVAALVAFAIVLVVVSGIPGLSYQTNDYVGHNSKYFDLITNPWPIYFEGADTFGCYYWGFYLVPALFSKLTGHLSVLAFSFWAFLGLLGGITLVFMLVKKSFSRLILFFFIGGIGHTAKVIFGFVSGLGFDHPIVFIEVWNMLNQFLWAPNQLIPTLLLASLIYYEGILGRNIFSCLFPLILIFIWSIFPSLVLSILMLITFLFFGGIGQLFALKLKTFIVTLALPVLICLPVFVYFLSSSGIPIRGFLWTFDPIKPVIIDYLSCVLLDVLVLWFVWKYLISNRMEVPDVYFYGLLLLIPVFGLYRFGFANDWLVRGTMPIFMILFIAVLRGQPVFASQFGKLTMICLILFCMIGPVSYFYRSLSHNLLLNRISGKNTFTPVPYDQYPNVYEAIKKHHGVPEASQYLGNKESVYWRSLSKNAR